MVVVALCNLYEQFKHVPSTGSPTYCGRESFDVETLPTDTLYMYVERRVMRVVGLTAPGPGSTALHGGSEVAPAHGLARLTRSSMRAVRRPAASAAMRCTCGGGGGAVQRPLCELTRCVRPMPRAQSAEAHHPTARGGASRTLAGAAREAEVDAGGGGGEATDASTYRIRSCRKLCAANDVPKTTTAAAAAAAAGNTSTCGAACS